LARCVIEILEEKRKKLLKFCIVIQRPVGHDQSAYKQHWHVVLRQPNSNGVFLSDDHAYLIYLRTDCPLPLAAAYVGVFETKSALDLRL